MPAASDTLVTNFAEAVRLAGGSVRVIGDARQVADRIEAIVREQAGQRAVLYESGPVSEGLGLSLAMSARGIRLRPVAEAREAPDLLVGVTEAPMAIAETGTLLVGGRPGGWGIASVLPWVHVALLRRQDIYPDMATGFAQFRQRFLAGERDWVWITGPSKTADIAKTLVMGIHGPNALEILIVGDSGANA